MTRVILHRRFVALGDSFTEGLGDPDPALPNGVRGWADRVAEQMSRATPVQYANLAIRGKRLDHVVTEQLGEALALRPDLVTLFAGVNDLMHVRVRMNELMQVYDDVVGRIRATGARVVLFTIGDPYGVPIFRPFRARVALYNELVRQIARRHDASIVDLWGLADLEDRRMWGDDRLHLSTPGHQVVARAVCEALGLEHDVVVDPPAPAPGPRATATGRLVWVLHHAIPWIARRVRRRSLGDGLSPRYPALTPPVLPPGLGVVSRLSGCDFDASWPSETPSPKASAIPTRAVPTAYAAGPTGPPSPSLRPTPV